MSSSFPAQRRSYWLKTLHRWHWISSAVSLICLLLFALTGITLNHASQIEAEPTIVTRHLQLPPNLVDALRPQGVGTDEKRRTVPPSLTTWLAGQLDINVDSRSPEWSPEELYIALPRPGGDAWVRIGRADGAIEYELTERGWIAYLNDLHKGRNSGAAWGAFIDVFALACFVFAATGLLILKMHAAQRTGTWPIVALGLLIPLLIVLLFVH